MSDEALKRDEIINEKQKLKRLKRLKKKQRYKTVVEEERPLYHTARFFSVLIQFCTAFLASCGMAAFLGGITKDKTTILFITVLALFIIEGVIRASGSSTIRNTIKKEDDGSVRPVKYNVLIALIAFTAISIFTTYAGSDATVQYFAISPDYTVIDSIEEKYSNLIALDNKKWNDKSLYFINEAKEIHKKNNWKGVTVSAAQEVVANNKADANSMLDSLTKHESILLRAKNTAIKEAKDNNKELLSRHEKDKVFYTKSLKYVSIVSYILLFILLYFIEQHEIRETDDLEEQLKGKDSIKNPTTVDEVEELKKKLEEYKEDIEKDVEDNKEYKDGDIKTFEGSTKVNRIIVKLDDGSLKEYKASELRNWIKNTTGKERKKELQTYLKKLQDHGRA